MKIKVLMEDTGNLPGLKIEHGLSLYIEACGRRILFDTGQSAAFADNAARLSVDLSAVELAILSHGHYDHAGGWKRFLQLNDQAPIYLNRHAFEEHINPAGKFIGVDPSLKNEAQLRFTDEYCRLSEGLELFTCNERETPHPIQSFGLGMKEHGNVVPDDFRHEQYLSIHENGKHILISGCSHKGILNITEWFEPDMLVGGFHFFKLNPDGNGRKYLDSAAESLSRHDTEYYTCHCTGTAQYEHLKKRLQDRIHYLSCGSEIEI